MNKKPGIGVGIVIVCAIVIVAMFTGCIEEETATPTVTVTPTVSSHAQEIVTGGFSPEVQKKLEPYRPSLHFDRLTPPPAPDYWLEDCWAALPFKKDMADEAPPNTRYPEAQATAAVDVFFVHPTGYDSPASWNAPWDDPGVATATADMMRYCASVFNAGGRVYAPRYRQATVYSWFDESTFGIRAIDLAYSDVERAFAHYIKFWNHGRPFILAGHSQGSFHGLRLLQEKIIDTPLEQRLVAAYLIGYSIPENIVGIKPSKSFNDTGVVIGWNTYTKDGDNSFFTKNAVIWIDGSYQKIDGQPIIQVNPLSWKLHGSEVSASENLGSLPALESYGPLSALIPDLTGADASGKVLIIKKNLEFRVSRVCVQKCPF